MRSEHCTYLTVEMVICGILLVLYHALVVTRSTWDNTDLDYVTLM